MPNHIGLDSISFGLGHYSLLEPSNRLPAFELDLNLASIDRFQKVEKNVAIDSIACKVEGLVNLDEYTGHWGQVDQKSYNCKINLPN